MGFPNTPDVLTEAVTFSERFAFRPLERLTETEASEALTQTAQTADVSWRPGVVDEGVAHPWHVRLIWNAVSNKNAQPNRAA